MDLNKLAVEISKLEGQKVPLTIAQIKEVIRCTGIAFSIMGQEEFVDTIYRMLTLKPAARRGKKAKAK